MDHDYHTNFLSDWVLGHIGMHFFSCKLEYNYLAFQSQDLEETWLPQIHVKVLRVSTE